MKGSSTPKGVQQQRTESKTQRRGKSPRIAKISQLAAHRSSGGISKTTSKQQSITNTPKSNISLPPRSSGGSSKKRVALAAQKKLFDPPTTTPHTSHFIPTAPPDSTVSKKLILSTPLIRKQDPTNTKIHLPALLQPETLATTAQQHTMRTATPPVTVAEAQELGEQARLRDEIMWALEGLVSSKGLSQQESFATILEIFANRRNRMALHANGITGDIFKAIGSLDTSCKDDVIIALGCAAVLLMLSQAGVDAKNLARNDFANLATTLLKKSDDVSLAAAASPPAARILRLLHDTQYSRFLPREASYSPMAVTLTALCNALDPHASPVEAESIKNAARLSGALRAVAQIAADQNHSIDDPKPTMKTVQSLWKLEKALIILEHACFACAENESHLVHMEVTQGMPPIIARMPFPQWLVQQVHALTKQELLLGLKKDCLRSLLAVLMNITQNNQDGCSLVISVGGADMVSSALVKIAIGSAHTRGALHSKEELVSWLDELSICLGLLINLAEDSQDCRQKLKVLSVASATSSTPSFSVSGPIRMIPLLSQLITTTIANSPHPAAGLAPSSQQQQQQGAGDEVTLDSLRHGEGEAIGSIVEVYAAILLGFMLEGDIEAQKEASSLLPGKCLLPVVVAVRNCLHFYVNAGALTQRTETSLRALLASLEPTVEGK